MKEKQGNILSRTLIPLFNKKPEQKTHNLKLIETETTKTTLDKIIRIQQILKEEQSVKERLQHNRQIMLLQLEKNCLQFYKSKVAIKEAFDYMRISSNMQINYKIIENTKHSLGFRYQSLYNLFFYLRNNNKMMLYLVNHCDKKDYETLAQFIVHFFYENILNSSFAQEDMLILIYLLIENFIDKNVTKETKISGFLDNSFLSEMFKLMTRKEDVRSYFVLLLNEIVLLIESEQDQILSINFNNIVKNRSAFSMKRKSSDIKDLSENNSHINANDNTVKDIDKYFEETETNLKSLEEKLKFYEKQAAAKADSKEIQCYLKQKIDMLNKVNNDKKDLLLSNKTFLKKISNDNTFKRNEAKIKLALYKNSKKIKELLDILIKNILENFTAIPYNIKCICIIIDKLIAEKFPDKSEYERMLYILSFFFNYMLIPILSNPEYNGIVTTVTISQNTRTNLDTIGFILSKIINGELFLNEGDCEYTIFNSYIIENMPNIFKLMQSMRNTKLPSKIDKLIEQKGEPTRNINYNYFDENHNENIQHQSVCFDWETAYIFIKIIKKYKDDFIAIGNERDDDDDDDNELERSGPADGNNNEGKKRKKGKIDIISTIDKVVEYEADLSNFIQQENVGKKIENNKNKQDDIDIIRKEKNFYYFEKIVYRQAFEDMLNGIPVHSSGITNAFHFTSKLGRTSLNQTSFGSFKKKDIKLDQKPKDSKVDIVKRFKKCLCEVLKFIGEIQKHEINLLNYSDVNEPDKDILQFDKDILPKLFELLKEEMCYNYDGVTENQTNSNQLSVVYSSSFLLKNLDQLPDNYRDKNYNLLITELLKEREQSLKDAKNDAINQLYLKVKNSDKLNMIINNILIQLRKMEKLVNIELLVDDFPVKVLLKYETNSEELIQKVELIEIKENDSNSSSLIKNNQKFYADTITKFLEIFPSFLNIKNKNILDYEEEIKLDEIIFHYFSIVKNCIKNSSRFSKYTFEEKTSLSEEVGNYIMNKLYDKLFPIKPNKKDIKIYLKCKRLEWVKPKHLIKDQKFVNEKLWGKAMNILSTMNSEKTPCNKINSFSKAFGILQNSITFCTGKDELGVDDSIQILLYVVLKSIPQRLNTNFNYSRLFIDPELSKKQFGLLLTQMEMIMTIIENMKYTDLAGVTEEQFGKDIKEDEIDINKNYY